MEDSVAKAGDGPGVPVMRFIGVKDEHLTGQAALRRPPISE